MDSWLLDTGPMVAYLDRHDPEHQAVVKPLEAHTGRLITTGAVIVEAMHLLGAVPRGPGLLVDFLLSSETEIHECISLEALTEAAELMAKYSDVPMDFADATLVLLGQRRKIRNICTLDRRGFRVYRMRGRTAFRLVLDEVTVRGSRKGRRRKG